MPQVIPEHMNLVDMQNSTATLTYKGLPPYTKGAGSILNIGSEAYVEIDPNYNDLIHNSRLFIYQKEQEIMSNICEFWNYDGIEVDKYRFERKLLENGALAVYRIGGKIYFSPYLALETDTMEKPTKIKIVENNNSLLNDLELTKFGIIRSHISEQSIWTMVLRYIGILEKILYALEDNINSSKPKGLLLTNGMKILNPTNKDMEEGMEGIINSPNTFFEIQVGDTENADNFNTDLKAFWIPLELADRAETLINQFNFFNGKLKEMFGLGLNTISKKERVIQDEMSEQQKVSNANIQHMYSIREIDIKDTNKVLGTNIKIIKNEELWEVGEPAEKEGSKDEKIKNDNSKTERN